MENVCERGSRLRSVSEKCWGATNYYSGKEAVLRGYSRPVWLCFGHAKKLQVESQRRCCFPSENACTQRNNLLPRPQRILTVAANLENYQGGAFLCQGHLNLVDEAPIFTNHALYKPPTTRKTKCTTSVLCTTPEKKITWTDGTSQTAPLQSVNELAEAKQLITKLQRENAALKERCNKLEEPTFDEQFKTFHKCLTKHYKDGGQRLYDPADMEKFANKCTPGLFNRALCLVKNDEKQQLSKKRHEILRLRVVALLHQLSYFRNQKNNPLQQDCGLHLSFHGASDDALTAGSLLGFSTHPRSVLNHKKGLSGKSIHKTQAIVESAIKNNNFLLLIIDDFQCVQSIKDPKQSQLSKCLHMCTGVVDHQESIPAMPTTRNVHRVVPVRIAGGAIVNCRGGIDANKVNELFQEHLSNYFTFSYLDSLPADFSQFDLTNVNKSLVELRVYTDEARHDLDLLSNTWLVDEFEQSLKSMASYRQAMQHLNEVCPSLSEYMEKNLLLLAGDWPTWYYNKKIICQWKPDVDPDRVLSVVPWQGPFHICLNSQEDVVANFHCFFEKLYKHSFGQRKVLPSKPKPHRISTLITTAFGGWLTVKTAVLPAFGQCKDPEYVLLVFLLDELVPLVFYFYSVIFRGGDQRKWVDAMIRLALMFIIQRRRHYDKATLCQLSDLVHQQEAIPNFQELLEQWLNELTEKKVEVFHSLLRRSVPPNATASQVQAAAKAISANRCAEDFCTWFLTNNPRGTVSEPKGPIKQSS
ncbi:unnamed protein product [Porites lobata]|uniref:Uncharacterized protein n=1 Tax=Porites lobata TaxID=104759 RepID=A0ABN8N8S8_9CNID|nr:unnamed protein product [Porites lobata]